MATRAADPHSIYGYDPDSGEPRDEPAPDSDEVLSELRRRATARRYRILDERRARQEADHEE